MLTVSKTKLKANMLELFREIEESGEEIVVTHHSKPVARITPIREKRPVDEVFADLQGKIIFNGDPDEPLTELWDLD